MTLAPRTRLGPYEVIAEIGAGGMGEVYRARDTRLGRDVAIKVLPASFAGDPGRRARFEREAQAIASLSHPNVLAVHDTGIHDGQIYLVMELLDGETLRDRLESGPLPVRRAIEIGAQIARGLGAAHGKGLVHRDLKPENVFLLKDGQVKILDFGLARVVRAGSDATETAPLLTEPGTVMGTVGYMAPEQVRGQDVDSRADLFALGAVLYEMLSGHRAFKRGTPAETLAAILNEEPPDPGPHASRAPLLDQIVRHCLEKNPNERFQSARDVAFALDSLSTSGVSGPVGAVSATRSSWTLIGTVAAVVLAAAAGLWTGGRLAPTADVTFAVKTFDRQTIFNARFLPDGAGIAYSAARQGTTPELFVLHPDRTAPELIGGPGTHLLSVSSKGELAVLTQATYIAQRLFVGTLARLTVGSAPRAWLDNVREADWSPDGSTLAVVHALRDGRDQLEYPAGTPLYVASGYLSDPRVSHDGQRVAFVQHKDQWDDRGQVQVVDTSRRVTTLSEEFPAVEGLSWSADDSEILFSAVASKNASQGFEVRAVASTGSPQARVVLHAPGSATILDVSRTGRWLFSSDEDRYGIVVKKPGESAEQEMSWLDLSSRGSLSEDGSLLAFSNQNSAEGIDYAVMLRRTDGSPPARLGDGSIAFRSLSPDRRWVAAEIASTHELVFYPTGAGVPRRIRLANNSFLSTGFTGWFPDGEHFLIVGAMNGSSPRCYMAATSDGAMEPVGPDGVAFCVPMPDEGLLAFLTDGSMLWYQHSTRDTPKHLPAPQGEPFDVARGGFLLVWSPSRTQDIRIERINLLTGGREPVADIALADRVGLMKADPTCVVGQPGRFGYSYTYERRLSKLVVASIASGR